MDKQQDLIVAITSDRCEVKNCSFYLMVTVCAHILQKLAGHGHTRRISESPPLGQDVSLYSEELEIYLYIYTLIYMVTIDYK